MKKVAVGQEMEGGRNCSEYLNLLKLQNLLV